MAFYIRARDAAGYITLRRDTREAAEKKAEELRQSGCFEIEIIQDGEPKAAWRRGLADIDSPDGRRALTHC